MRHHCLAIGLFLLTVFATSAADLSFNNEPVFNFPPNQNAFPPYSYPEGFGYPLSEILPAYAEVWYLEIVDETGTIHVLRQASADAIRLGRLIETAGSWTLITEDAQYTDLRSLSVQGEPLEDRSLEIWISWEGTDHLSSAIHRFASAADVAVDIQVVPSILSKATSVARGGGRLPDVFMVQSDYLPELVYADLIQTLNGMDSSSLLEKGTQAFGRDDQLWAWPLYFDSQLVFTNPRLSGTPPMDWDLETFESILEDLSSQGISPITWNAYSAYWLIPFQLGFGKDNLLEEDGSLVVNDSATHDAITYLLDLQDRGLLDIRERDGMMTRFVTGDVGMILSGSYSIPAFRDAGVEFSVVPYPYNPSTGRWISPLLDFKGFAVSRRTYRPILARRLLEYLTDTGVQNALISNLAKLPADRQALELRNDGSAEALALLASYEIGTVIPPNDVYPIFKNTMWKMLSFAFTGQMTVDDLLQQGQVIIDDKLERRIP